MEYFEVTAELHLAVNAVFYSQQMMFIFSLPNVCCRFSTWCLPPLFCMISTTTALRIPNSFLSCKNSYRFVCINVCIVFQHICTFQLSKLCLVVVCLLAVRCTLRCIALFHWDEELNSKEAIQEEGSQSQNSLGNTDESNCP
ncbi:hypothetical protein Ddye_022435 [Dipteronia dyeriana]|uniref:Uncharacterized protein n=1 Tax=Dipteronia dyeriana TaxID=168575 RepID=A0AAD9U3G2_9ROSI|nr:hypothetical protein Ddye_022435 [Dipteronia dyeriana]